MKILATLTLNQKVGPAVVRAELPNELRGAWTLYAAGIIREAYSTEPPTRVVFMLGRPCGNRAALFEAA